MTQSSDIPNRVDRLENDVIDIKVAVSALIETANRHQTNFERIVSEIRDIRTENQAILTEMRTENQAILTEMRDNQTRVDATLNSINAALERFDRVLDYLLRQQDNS